jgi:hypothetical protein
LNWAHACANPGVAPAEAEHGVLRLLEDDDLDVRLGDSKTIERGLQRFGDGLPSCLDPLHR